MNEQTQNQRPKGKKSFILAILLMIVAIVLGTLLYYGFQIIQNKGFQYKSDQTQEVGNITIVKTTPTPLPTTEAPSQTEVTDQTSQENNTSQQSEEVIQPNTSPIPSSTPVITEEPTKPTAVKVKGIYVTGPRAGSGDEMDKLIDLVDTTELNAMVIDIKNDSGEITYKMNSPMVKEIGAGTAYIHNMKSLIKRLKKKDIYLIARVVAFKDPKLAEQRPDLSLKTKNGKTFRDDAGLSWVNPYKKEVWDYLVEVGTKAAELGFDEVQFDYIRFSTDSGMKNVDFGIEGQETSKTQIISQFTQYAYEKLSAKGVFVSADVYGTIIGSKVDAKIVGQSYGKMATNLDYICPMIYPSHYADGSYAIDHPDTKPYDLILKALQESKQVLNRSKADQVAIVRPWLQDFTASWLEHYIEYDKEEIRAQIKAVQDAGYEEWILWNGSNRYTQSGLLKE